MALISQFLAQCVSVLGMLLIDAVDDPVFGAAIADGYQRLYQLIVDYNFVAEKSG